MNYDFVAMTVQLQELLDQAKDPTKKIDPERMARTISNVRKISHAIEMSLARIGNLARDIEDAVRQREPTDITKIGG